MRRRLLILATASPLLGCSRVEEEVPTSWKTLALPGKNLELIDEKHIEIYRFTESWMAIATFGLKGGAIASPVVYWKILENRLIISIHPDSEILQELLSPAIDGNFVIAMRKAGSIVKYKIT